MTGNECNLPVSQSKNVCALVEKSNVSNWRVCSVKE